MQTECSAEQFEFEGLGARRVVAAFDGGAVTSDAGGPLLRHTDRALGLIERVAARFQDNREQDQVVHTLPDDPLHGQQEGRFFHGYYSCYCYLPLYVFCGRHLLAALLRPSNIDASGAVAEIARIVARIRAAWLRQADERPERR